MPPLPLSAASQRCQKWFATRPGLGVGQIGTAREENICRSTSSDQLLEIRGEGISAFLRETFPNCNLSAAVMAAKLRAPRDFGTVLRFGQVYHASAHLVKTQDGAKVANYKRVIGTTRGWQVG